VNCQLTLAFLLGGNLFQKTSPVLPGLGVKTLPAFKQNAVVAQTTFNPDSFLILLKR
jgi:hypothetical protein